LSSGGEFTGQLAVAYDGQDIIEGLQDKIILIPERPQDFDLESTVRAGIELGIKGLLFEEGEPRWFHKTTSVFANLGIPVIRIRKSIALELANKPGNMVAISLPLDTTNRQCHNVIGIIPGEDPSITIALTAHFDHIGDDPGSFRFPGALDNASGTAAVLELARKLVKEKHPLPFNLLVCFLTGEESGHWGAKHLIQHQPLPISAVINLDVLGLDPEFKDVRIGQITPEHWLSELTANILEENNVTVRRLKGNDDAAVFLNSKIPAIGIGEYRLHKIGPNIHTPEDQIEAIHYEPLLMIIDIVSKLLTQISSETIKTVVNI
jgi:Iap family predicted aminopeptidase